MTCITIVLTWQGGGWGDRGTTGGDPQEALWVVLGVGGHFHKRPNDWPNLEAGPLPDCPPAAPLLSPGSVTSKVPCSQGTSLRADRKWCLLREDSPHTSHPGGPRAPGAALACRPHRHLTSWLFPSEKLGTHSTRRDMIWALVLDGDARLTGQEAGSRDGCSSARWGLYTRHPAAY